MSSLHQTDLDHAEVLFHNPWPFLVASLAVLLVTLPFASSLGSGIVIFVVIGLLLASIGIVIRPGSWRVLASAALCGVIAYICMLSLSLGVSGSMEVLRNFLAGQHEKLPAPWDSARLMIGVLILEASLRQP
jgi:hypothetical protein